MASWKHRSQLCHVPISSVWGAVWIRGGRGWGRAKESCRAVPVSLQAEPWNSAAEYGGADTVCFLSSLMKDYFFKPPISKLSLNFLDQDLEMAYRTSYQEEVRSSWHCFSAAIHPSRVCNCFWHVSLQLMTSVMGCQMRCAARYCCLWEQSQFTCPVSYPESSPLFEVDIRSQSPPGYAQHLICLFSVFKLMC